MKTTILLPHYRTREMTAYSIRQFLELTGRHEINIVIIDNGGGVGLDLVPVDDRITIITYPADQLLQSQGIAFDYALQTVPHLIEECFIAAESDSFPTHDKWLDHYEGYMNAGLDLAGSKVNQSGGQFIHPAGAMYRKSNWLDAMETVRQYGYHLYEAPVPPSTERYHVMSKELIQGDDAVDAKRIRFLPIATGVFHQGMGFNDESLQTYWLRNMESEPPTILPRDGKDRYQRIMYEPGQWFCYWHIAMGKKIKKVPTEIQWLPNRENQAQEYTLMENGFKHLWGITAYTACGEDSENIRDVINFKKAQLQKLVSP